MLQPPLGAGEDHLLGVLPDGEDQGEAELLLVGVVQPMKLPVLPGLSASRPADACSLFDAGVSSPAMAALPARSGCARMRAILRPSGPAYRPHHRAMQPIKPVERPSTVRLFSDPG